MKRTRQTKHLEDIVGSLIKRLEKQNIQKGNAVREAWGKSAGEKTLEHAQPIGFKKGTLMVVVENSTWLYKLTLEKRNIIKKFNENYKGKQKLKEIRLRVGKTENL